MLTFLRLCQQEVIPWRFRVRLALDLATTLAVLHQSSDFCSTPVRASSTQQRLDWHRVRIDDVHWRAYFRTSGKHESQTEPTKERENIFHFGIILCTLMTGGKHPASFLNPNGDLLNEAVIEASVLPGCPALLEALAYSCCNINVNRRPAAKHVAETLSMLLSELCAPLLLDASGAAYAKRSGTTDYYSYLYSPSATRSDPVCAEESDALMVPTPDISLPREVRMILEQLLHSNTSSQDPSGSSSDAADEGCEMQVVARRPMLAHEHSVLCATAESMYDPPQFSESAPLHALQQTLQEIRDTKPSVSTLTSSSNTPTISPRPQPPHTSLRAKALGVSAEQPQQCEETKCSSRVFFGGRQDHVTCVAGADLIVPPREKLSIQLDDSSEHSGDEHSPLIYYATPVRDQAHVQPHLTSDLSACLSGAQADSLAVGRTNTSSSASCSTSSSSSTMEFIRAHTPAHLLRESNNKGTCSIEHVAPGPSWGNCNVELVGLGSCTHSGGRHPLVPVLQLPAPLADESWAISFAAAHCPDTAPSPVRPSLRRSLVTPVVVSPSTPATDFIATTRRRLNTRGPGGGARRNVNLPPVSPLPVARTTPRGEQQELLTGSEHHDSPSASGPAGAVPTLQRVFTEYTSLLQRVQGLVQGQTTLRGQKGLSPAWSPESSVAFVRQSRDLNSTCTTAEDTGKDWRSRN